MFNLTELLLYLPLIFLVWFPITAFFWAQYRNTYWSRHNVPFIRPLPFLGNFKDILFFQKCVSDKFKEFYMDKSVRNAPFCGIYIFHKPAIFVRDPELMKQILIKDFNSFSERYSDCDVHEPLSSKNLFFARSNLWKKLRPRLSPIFTSGKMRQMFQLIAKIGQELDQKMLSMKLNEKTNSFETEAKEFAACYTTDVIASCAYGVQANSIQNPESDFRRNGRAIFHFTLMRALEMACLFFCPEWVTLLKCRLFGPQSAKFLTETINYVMDERQKTGLKRNDLIDLMLELKNEDKSKVLDDNDDVVFRGDIVVAQAAVFFAAGFDTSSATMSFGLYELANQPDLQKRLREEIKETLLKHNGEITYDTTQNMVYLNMVISEILRMHPILPFLDRKLGLEDKNATYSLKPFSDYELPNGAPVYIPTSAIQRDPKYWPNPHHFDPERFSAANKHKIVPYTYLPFGTGPHNCIGERFGLMQTRVGLINFLKNHYVTLAERMPKVMKYERKALLIQSEGGIDLNVFRDPLL